LLFLYSLSLPGGLCTAACNHVDYLEVSLVKLMHGSYVVNVLKFEIQSSTWIVVAAEGQSSQTWVAPK
jgi:hypothetical protein